MLFQGEEWAASSPFAFFTSHPEQELGEAVSQGRLREFERMGWDESQVPDPQDPQTLQMSKLDWSETERGRHAVLLEVYRELAELRRRIPELTDPDLRTTRCEYDEDARWFLMRRGGVVVALNLGEQEAVVDLGGEHELRWATPGGAGVDHGRVALPTHAGAVLVPLV
jgi:1,4-alpha-glucan branching enzyme